MATCCIDTACSVMAPLKVSEVRSRSPRRNRVNGGWLATFEARTVSPRAPSAALEQLEEQFITVVLESTDEDAVTSIVYRVPANALLAVSGMIRTTLRAGTYLKPLIIKLQDVEAANFDIFLQWLEKGELIRSLDRFHLLNDDQFDEYRGGLIDLWFLGNYLEAEDFQNCCMDALRYMTTMQPWSLSLLEYVLDFKEGDEEDSENVFACKMLEFAMDQTIYDTIDENPAESRDAFLSLPVCIQQGLIDISTSTARIGGTCIDPAQARSRSYHVHETTTTRSQTVTGAEMSHQCLRSWNKMAKATATGTFTQEEEFGTPFPVDSAHPLSRGAEYLANLEAAAAEEEEEEDETESEDEDEDLAEERKAEYRNRESVWAGHGSRSRIV